MISKLRSLISDSLLLSLHLTSPVCSAVHHLTWPRRLSTNLATPSLLIFGHSVCFWSNYSQDISLSKVLAPKLFFVNMSLTNYRLSFAGSCDESLYKNIVKCKVEIPTSISQPARTLIKSILREDPEERISLEEVSRQGSVKYIHIFTQIPSRRMNK